MKTRIILCLIIPMMASAIAGCQRDDAVVLLADNTPASGCLGCHKGAMSFGDRDPEALADLIKAIRDESRAHPPLRLDDTSDAAIERLAKELTSN